MDDSITRGFRFPGQLLRDVEALCLDTDLTVSRFMREAAERLLGQTRRDGYIILKAGSQVQAVSVRTDGE